jgi:putative addiction module killer protein
MSNGLAVVEYVREDGSNPYRAWFDSPHAQAAAKVATAMVRLELGNLSRGPGYRVYLGKDGDKLVILLGGTKQRQQADIGRAKAMWEEYKTRKAAAAKPQARR